MASVKRKMVYVGGLDQGVSEEVLHAAFIPFGDIREVSIPKDFAESITALRQRFSSNFFLDKHRGFGFVDFEDAEDAAAAIENMNGAELLGKVLKCNLAKPMTKLQPGKAVWTAEEWLSNSLKAHEDDDKQTANLE